MLHTRHSNHLNSVPSLDYPSKLSRSRVSRRMASLHSKSSSSFFFFSFSHISLRCSSLFLVCVLLLLHASFLFQPVMGAPLSPEESLSSSGASSVEDAFRARIAKDSTSKVYIDTLTPEEVAERRKTGRLPKRTLELIERVLKAQGTQQQQKEKDSRDTEPLIGPGDLLEELFHRKS